MFYDPKSKVKVTAEVKVMSKNEKCGKCDKTYRKLKITIFKFSYKFHKNLKEEPFNTLTKVIVIFYVHAYFNWAFFSKGFHLITTVHLKFQNLHQYLLYMSEISHQYTG